MIKTATFILTLLVGATLVFAQTQTTQPQAPTEAGSPPARDAQVQIQAQAAPPPPPRQTPSRAYKPSEEIRADTVVSFPADI